MWKQAWKQAINWWWLCPGKLGLLLMSGSLFRGPNDKDHGWDSAWWINTMLSQEAVSYEATPTALLWLLKMGMSDQRDSWQQVKVLSFLNMKWETRGPQQDFFYTYFFILQMYHMDKMYLDHSYPPLLPSSNSPQHPTQHISLTTSCPLKK